LEQKVFTKQSVRAVLMLLFALAAGYFVSNLSLPGLGEAGRITLGIFTIAAILWMLEPFPLYVTSFLIVILEVVFLARPGGPLAELGITYKAFLAPFFDSVIVLLLGGFVMAIAVKRYRLDELISRRILRRVGREPKAVLGGMMVASAFLSMWLSNTATTALMLAVAIPIVQALPEGERFRKAIVLGIPFACNIGGMGTPIGTPPNAIAIGILGNIGQGIDFLGWMLRGVPMVVVLLALAWFVLCRIFRPEVERIEIDLGEKRALTGRMKLVLVTFVVVVLLWLTSGLHGIPSSIVALVPVIVFFGMGLLEDNDLRGVGWNVLFIVGGGMSLGVAMSASGLTEWLVHQIPFEGMGLLFVLVVFALAAAALTTFISNSATANLLIPIVVGVSAISPGRSAVVIALASSAAMILPISTPPNAIAYGSGLVRVKDMARAGSVITIVAAVLISLFIYLVF
jgi:sodium-dependent dicarboxylate transporter 2/3/5